MAMISKIYGSPHYMREIYTEHGQQLQPKPKKKKRSKRKLNAYLRRIKKARQLKQQFAAEMLLNPTPLEFLLDSCLRAVIKGRVQIERQKVLSGYIADFFIPALKLVFEADGPQHTKPAALAYDKRRDYALARRGIQTIRLTAKFIQSHRREDIEEAIRAALNARRLFIKQYKPAT